MAEHEGTVGDYALLMPMTTEQAVIGGRETFGEPKKLGRGHPRLATATTCTGRFARMGITFVEVNGTVIGAAPAHARAGTAHQLLLQVPARTRRQGLRRRAAARLLPPRREDPKRSRRRRPGHRCASRRFDPVVDLPVRAHREHRARRAHPASRPARSSRTVPARLARCRTCTSATTTSPPIGSATGKRVATDGTSERPGRRRHRRGRRASAGRWPSASPRRA